jgi:ADP-heptose:LPS heptosyltransferase
MPRGTAAVVRFSSLGDVLLAAHLPSFLRAADPGRRVLFVTKGRYAAALRGHPDVDRFYVLADGPADPAAPAPLGVRGSLGDLIAFLRQEQIAEVIDVHQNLRSSRVVGALEGAKRTLPSKHALRRRIMVHARWLNPAPLPPLLRVYREIAGLPGDAPIVPWLRAALTDSERARACARRGSSGRRFVVLGAGARWETKRWPARHFVSLAEGLGRLGYDALIAIAPWERDLRDEFTALLPADRRDDLVALEVREAAALASHASAIVSNDSALLHLGPALGVPAVGLFGSTVPAFGFAPQGPRDRVVEVSLSCRPCDVHGKRRCPLRHHACMETLQPAAVLEALAALLGAPGSSA